MPRAGEPIPVVSERPGHASPAITVAVHAHGLRDSQDAAADPIGPILFAGDPNEQASWPPEDPCPAQPEIRP